MFARSYVCTSMHIFLSLLTVLTLFAGCAASVPDDSTSDDDAPIARAERDAGDGSEPHYADGNPEPIYTVRDDASAPSSSEKPDAQQQLEHDDAGVDAGAPVAPPETTPEPAVDAGAMPEPEPTVDAGAMPAPSVTSCKLPSGVVLTCASQALYGLVLRWSAGSTSYSCAVVPAVQCTAGDSCRAFHSDGSVESGVCK